MNFVLSNSLSVRISKVRVLFSLFLIILLSINFVGCGDQVLPPSPEGLAEFENAGPVRPTVDMDRLVEAKIGGGPYRVVPGDVLELTMPTILRVVTAERPDVREQITPYVCRVSKSGTITLPMVGEIEAAGKSLAEIESAVIDAYYPEYAVTRPSVVARVTEYRTAKVSITGAVENPGVYELRSDQMSLVALLMEAGGIIDEGASLIRIIHSEEPEEIVPRDEETLKETNGETIEQMLRLINERAHKRAIERLIEPSEFGVVISPAAYPNHNEIEVQLTFEQIAPPSTVGRFVMKHDETILLTEQVDITSKIQRQALLEKLVQREPRVSVADMKQRLCALAELLKPGSGICNSENETTNENINFFAKLNINDSRQNSTSDELLNKELLEILELEKDLQIREKAALGKPKKPEPFVLPVKGLNIPFADVALQDGDTVIVERLEQPLFTVLGLVNRPGNFPYPPDVRYNLMQTVGFAGGLDKAAEPRYATIYRLRPDGTIVSAIFKVVDGSRLTDSLNTLVKPGDIVAIEHTPRTRTKLFLDLDRVFRINMGVYVPLYLLDSYR